MSDVHYGTVAQLVEHAAEVGCRFDSRDGKWAPRNIHTARLSVRVRPIPIAAAEAVRDEV